MKIGLAGAGGIGSNVAVNLVRSGICSLKILDYDTVEVGNLNRQFYFRDQVGKPKITMLAENLARINPAAHIDPLTCRTTRNNIIDVFADCPIVVEGLDRQQDKKMLVETLTPHKELIVAANGIAGASISGITTRKMDNCIIVGDFSTDCASEKLYAHKVLTIAAIMTHHLIEHVEETP